MRPINIFNLLITWNNPFGVDVPLMGRNQKVFLQKQELSQSEVLSKDADLLLNFFSSGVFFFHIFTASNQLPGFFISRISKCGGFLNVNVFFNCKCKFEYKQFFI